MLRKIHDNFIPADVGRNTYSTIVTGIFVWGGNVIDEED